MPHCRTDEPPLFRRPIYARSHGLFPITMRLPPITTQASLKYTMTSPGARIERPQNNIGYYGILDEVLGRQVARIGRWSMS